MPSPFVRPVDRPQCPGTDFVPIDEDLIEEFEVKPRLIRVGKGEFDFITKDTVVKVRQYSRAEAIREHADEVGILNIIAKVRATGDTNLLNQRIPEYSNLEIKDTEEKLNDAIAAKANYANLPDNLTGGKSFNDFTDKPMTQAEFEAYIEAEVNKRIEASKPKESEVNQNA